MEKLDKILDACVAKGQKTTKDELLGVAFVVVNKDGEPSSPPPLLMESPRPLLQPNLKSHPLTGKRPQE